jgi:flagellar motor switch protein FliN/FliY
VPTLDKVVLDIQVVLGTTTMPVHQVLRLGRGAIIELDASEDDEVSILANSFPVAKGTVVVSGNRIAVEVKERTRGSKICAEAGVHSPADCPENGLGKRLGASPCSAGADLLHRRRRFGARLRARRSSHCGRGGIGRRTSLRC